VWGSARPKATTYTEQQGQMSMPRAGLEPTIPVFVRLKTVRPLDRAAIGTGKDNIEMDLKQNGSEDMTRPEVAPHRLH